MSASNHKVGSPINVWQSLANKFINQSSQLKVYWDKVGEIVREKHDALCDYIDSYIATKQELQDVTIGLIPDGTVTQDKLAPSLKDSLPAQYVRNRIPTSGDNFASGHKIGDAWYIPDITLNNLVPTPLAINTADFTIQNANASASGSAVTLSCLGGFDFASFKRTITPVAGALYVLFAELKLTSTHVLTSLSLNDQVIASPVKDTVYHVACVVTAPTEIEIKAQALDGTALNGATVVIDKLTIVNMTADMDGVPFDKAGAETYFQVNPAFLTHKFNNAKTRWYCSDNGVWQSSSQLTDETKAIYGVENMDDALKLTNLSSYIAFCTNANKDSLDAGFGRYNEGEMIGIGRQLAMYSNFKGESLSLPNLRSQLTLRDCFQNALGELLSSESLRSLISSSPFAFGIWLETLTPLRLLSYLNVDIGENPTWEDVVGSNAAMMAIVEDAFSLKTVVALDYLKSTIIANITTFNNLVTTMKATLDSSPSFFTPSSANGSASVLVGTAKSFVYIDTMNDTTNSFAFSGLKHNHNGVEVVHPTFITASGTGIITVQKFAIGGANITAGVNTSSLYFVATKYEAV